MDNMQNRILDHPRITSRSIWTKEGALNLDDTPVNNLVMENVQGTTGTDTADYSLPKLNTLAALSRNKILRKMTGLRAKSEQGFGSFRK